MKLLLLTFALALSPAFALLLPSAAQAAPQSVRWTVTEDANSEFGHVLDVLNAKTGLKVSGSDFIVYEDRDLATSHFRTYLQTVGGTPLAGMGIRVWSDLKTQATIQVEAQLEDGAQVKALRARLSRLNVTLQNSGRSRAQLTTQLLAVARRAVLASAEDPTFQTVSSRDVWENGDLVRVYRVTARRGHHLVHVSMERAKVSKIDYVPFKTADNANEFSVPANVFTIWEETPEGQMENRVLSQLRHLKSAVPRVTVDPFGSLRARRYFTDKQDTVLGLTAEGQAQGFWSMVDLKQRAAAVRTSLPLTPNSFANGVLLQGRYATVSLHPDVMKKFSGIGFQPGVAAEFFPAFVGVANDPSRFELIPGAALIGRPLTSYEDAVTRVARRLPDHNPVGYINDGFDEVQVYWSIDTLFESLHAMGFTDPELSTRPFNAFLFNPDVEYRDNAFYTDDTINFTTYSAANQNYARDNSTIWHELGHGVMDRLMGDLISLNDTGGLSEGMADFVAQMVISKVTALQHFAGDQDFRIINKTGFNLTNEEHDDGEAYGGAMYDLLSAAAAKAGLAGVVKVSDLTMETMRLTRNHPGLTATDWFNHMIFADQLGHVNADGTVMRAPGEMHELIMGALNGRNFSFDGKGLAVLHIFNGTDEVVTRGTGTRYSPVIAKLQEADKSTYTLKVLTEPGANGVLTYPLKVVVGLNGGPLQGSVHWDGEENGSLTFMLNSPADAANFTLTASGKCDAINREDGGCSDYAYIQLFPPGATRPVAKKRFYVRIMH